MPESVSTILNVNDREPNRYATSRVLRAAGFQVIEAGSGAEALEKARALPSLVVLDVNLPDMSGFEVARRLKSDPITRHLLVLHVSAISTFARHRAEGLDRGADGYLTEPFEAEELIATINALLRLGRAEANARAAAAEWQSTFDALWEGLALVGRDGTIRRHNGSLGRILGEPGLDGRALVELLPARAVVEPALQRIFAGDGRQVLEIEEGVRAFRITLEPVGGAHPLSAVAAVEDITQLKRAQHAVHLLSEAGQILMSSLDYEQTLVRVSSSAVPGIADHCVIDLQAEDGSLRRIAASVDGCRWRERLEQERPDPAQRTLVVERALFAGEPTLLSEVRPDDFPHIARSESHRALLEELDVRSLISVPLRVRDRVSGAMTLFACGAHRHFTQDDLRVAGELARRAAMAVENARLHREAQQALQMRDEFFSIASHELKNPLSALLLQLKTLQRELHRPQPTITPEILVRKVDSAERSATRMGQLIQEMLDTTRVRAGRLELRPEEVDLGQLAVEVAQRLENEAVASNSPITLDLAPGVVGLWDHSRLEQVLMNLISNAVKYGNGKPILVRAERRRTLAILEVQDRGLGIPLVEQRRVFEPFERGRATSGSAVTGLGLGLYISRKIVEAHGGAIYLASEPGEGSTFTVVLPLAAMMEGASTAGATAE